MFDVVELRERCRKAACADVALAGDAELCEVVRELASARASLAAAEAHVLGELEARGVCDRDFGSKTATWVAWQTREPRAAVAARVRLGSALRRLDAVDDLLSEGRIGVEHARVVADAAANPRVVDHVVDLQDELVAIASANPFAVLRGRVRELVELLDQDGGFDPARDLARNHLRLVELGPDQVEVSGVLVNEHALVVRHALQRGADRLFRRMTADHERTGDLVVPGRATLMALALAEACRAASSTDPERSVAPAVDVTVVVDVDQPDLVRTVDGERLRSHPLRHLCCDAAVTPVTISGAGVPLALGRSRRRATPAQRRALAVGDGGCVFPGCDAPTGWCDAHHVDPWETGGSTDLPNLALLCRHHHGVTHRRGWAMVAHADQTFSWTTPSRGTLQSQRYRGSSPRADPVRSRT